MSEAREAEVSRLENLWSGEFGDEYVDRNIKAYEGREELWKVIIEKCKPGDVLEIGCNVGANLYWLEKMLPSRCVHGMDVNEKSLALLRKSLPQVNTIWGVASRLPYRDEWFDIVFTTGVLIHQPRSVLPVVMSEIVRCSKRYVLCGEYYSEELIEVPYRKQSGALFKEDYGKLYLNLFPELNLIHEEFRAKEKGGWDDVTFWLFEKS